MKKEAQSENTKSGAAKREEEILAFWQKNNIFEKTEGRGEEEFIFYDGPPFATGLPHYGHLLQSAIKDAVPRYQAMRGRKLRRRWGWDCHGLPLENEIEKELGVSTKKEIVEKIGIEKFNEKARSRVLRYADDWEKIIPRLGRFVDMDDDYRTMDSSYTESVWWAFKTLYDKGLIYKGFKAMHLCPRCGTTLSNFEVNQGYKDISDLAVTIKFKLADEPNTYLLAWTTTPWTLPGNFALAVNPEIEYVKTEIKNYSNISDGVYIFSKKDYKNYQKLIEEEKTKNQKAAVKISGTFKGKDLIGKSYKPLFDYYTKADIPNKENAWKIYGADFVSTEEGTGIVHIAPAFGDDDLKLAEEKKIPIVHHVDENGRFKKEVNDFAGLFVKPKDDKEKEIDHTDTDVEVLKHLAQAGLIFAKEKVTHSYPHCWRCETPLLNFAASSWFVKVTEIKDKLVKENEKVHWVPETIGKYRFGNWLSEARDWAISRARFWGAPLPVWESADGKKKVVLGSVEDIRKHSKKSGNEYFVMRHGEAESNVINVTSGSYRDKVHITERGREEIKKSAAKLKEKKIDLIFSSDFVRTKETAKLAAETIGLNGDKIIFDKRLREVNTGDLSGKPNDEYHNYFSSLEEKFTKRPPHGENLLDIKRRVMEFIYEIEEKYKDRKILIVTHEYAAWMLWTGAFGWSNKQSAADKSKKEDFIKTGEIIELPFVSLPHNKNFEIDFHRPYIDEIIFEKDGEPLRRIPEVFDCWFESGSMPYGQDHYPFEKEFFDPEKNKGYPARFIGEAIDQTRGWFYSLLVLGVALFGRSPYQNVICSGLILSEDGQKMSKSLKNYPDPMEILRKYGADALRYYLLSSPVVRGEDFNFSERGVNEVAKKHIGRLLNTLSFFKMYADKTAGESYSSLRDKARQSKNILDQWILACLLETIKEVGEAMDKYELDRALRPVALFIDNLSTWYLRRSRGRFKSDNPEEKNAGSVVTRYVLAEFSKIIAPFMPFTAEFVFQRVKTEDAAESVHLEKWPIELGKKVRGEGGSQELLERMEKVRGIVTLGLEARARAGIKVRQPLSKLGVRGKGEGFSEELKQLIKDEVNVKEIVFDEKMEKEVGLDITITSELKEEGNVREIIRAIQDMRKNKNLEPTERIAVKMHAAPHIAEAVLKHQEEIKRLVGAALLQVGSGELGGKADFEVTIEKIS